MITDSMCTLFMCVSHAVGFVHRDVLEEVVMRARKRRWHHHA